MHLTIECCSILWNLCKAFIWCKSTWKFDLIEGSEIFGAFLFWKKCPFGKILQAALIFWIRSWWLKVWKSKRKKNELSKQQKKKKNKKKGHILHMQKKTCKRQIKMWSHWLEEMLNFPTITALNYDVDTTTTVTVIWWCGRWRHRHGSIWYNIGESFEEDMVCY